MPVSSSEVSGLLAAQNQQFMQTMGYAHGVTEASGTGNLPNPLSMANISPDARQASAFAASDTAASGIGTAASGMGMGMMFASAFGMAPRALDPFTAAIHQGARGWATHGAAGALGRGLIGGLGPAMAVATAASTITDSIISGMQQQSQLGLMAQQSLPGMGTNLPGMSLGSGGIYRPTLGLSNDMGGAMGSVMNQYAETTAPMGMAEMGSHMQFGSQMGTFRGAGSVGDFRSKLSTLVTQTRAVARQLQSSLGEAQAAMAEVSSMGISQGAAAALIPGLQGTSAVTGIGVGQAIAMGQQGATLFRQMGLTGAQGGGFTMGLANRIGVAAETGIISKENMARMGGVSGALSRYTSAGTNFFGSEGGQQMLGAMMTSSGDLDIGMAERIASGGVTWAEIRKEFRQRAGGMSGRGMLAANQQELSGQFMSQFGMQGLLPAVDLATRQSKTGQRFGADFALQQFTGMGREDLLGLQSMEAAGPMIQQQLASAARAGLSEGRMTGGGDIGTRISQAISNLTQPVRATFRGIGQRMSAGLSEAIGGLQSDLGMGPAPNAIAPGVAGGMIHTLERQMTDQMMMGGALMQAGGAAGGRYDAMAGGNLPQSAAHFSFMMAKAGGPEGGGMGGGGFDYSTGPATWMGQAGAAAGVLNFPGSSSGLGLAGIMGGRVAGAAVQGIGSGLMTSGYNAFAGAGGTAGMGRFAAGEALYGAGGMARQGLGGHLGKGLMGSAGRAFGLAGETALSAGGFGGRALGASMHGARGLAMGAAGVGMRAGSMLMGALGLPLLVAQTLSGKLTEGIAEWSGELEIGEDRGALPEYFGTMEAEMGAAGIAGNYGDDAYGQALGRTSQTMRVQGDHLRMLLDQSPNYRPIAGTGRGGVFGAGARTTGAGLGGHLSTAIGHSLTQSAMPREAAIGLVSGLRGDAGLEKLLGANIDPTVLREMSGSMPQDLLRTPDPTSVSQFAIRKIEQMASNMTALAPKYLERLQEGLSQKSTEEMTGILKTKGYAAAALRQVNHQYAGLTKDMMHSALGGTSRGRSWDRAKAGSDVFMSAVIDAAGITFEGGVGSSRLDRGMLWTMGLDQVERVSKDYTKGGKYWTTGKSPDEINRMVAEGEGLVIDKNNQLLSRIDKKTGLPVIEVGADRITDANQGQKFITTQFLKTVAKNLTPEESWELHKLAKTDPGRAQDRLRRSTSWQTAQRQLESSVELQDILSTPGMVDTEALGSHVISASGVAAIRRWQKEMGPGAEAIAEDLITNAYGGQSELLEAFSTLDTTMLMYVDASVNADGTLETRTSMSGTVKHLARTGFNTVTAAHLKGVLQTKSEAVDKMFTKGLQERAKVYRDNFDGTGGFDQSGNFMKQYTGMISGPFADAVHEHMIAAKAFSQGESAAGLGAVSERKAEVLRQLQKLPPAQRRKALQGFRTLGLKGNAEYGEMANQGYDHSRATSRMEGTISGSGEAKRGVARQQQFAAIFGGLNAAEDIMSRRGRKLAKGGALILTHEDKENLRDELAQRIMEAPDATLSVAGLRVDMDPVAARQQATTLVTKAMNVYENDGVDEDEMRTHGLIMNQIAKFSVTTSGGRKRAGDTESWARSFNDIMPGIIDGLKKFKGALDK